MKINFDMDGTIANLYGVENWLDFLIAEDTTPYAIAEPLLRLNLLARYLNKLQKMGYEIGIISWTSKSGSDAYNEAVAEVKREWLKKHLKSVNWDYIKIVPYGTPKHTLADGILFDDEERNRTEWGEGAYDVDNILEILKDIANGKPQTNEPEVHYFCGTNGRVMEVVDEDVLNMMRRKPDWCEVSAEQYERAYALAWELACGI